MDRDLKEIVGAMMRVLGGDAVSRREVEELEFEASGELERVLNEAFLKLLEYAYDCEEGNYSRSGDLRVELHQLLDDIVRLADESRIPLGRSIGTRLPALGVS